MARKDEFDDEGFFDSLLKRQASTPMPPSMLKLLVGVAGVAVVATIIAVAWATWPDGNGRVDEDNLPVLRAEDGVYKIKPEEPGGMAVPNKDSTIFEALNADDNNQKTVENLLDEPEDPIKKEEVFGKDEEQIASTPDPEPEVAPTANEKVEKVEKVEEPTKPKEDIAKVEEKKVEPSKPEPVKKAGGTSYIQLAAVKSDADAKAKWSKLQSQHSSLQPLSLRVQKADLGAKGTFYRVQAGPMSVDDAQSACGKIKAAGGDCLVLK